MSRFGRLLVLLLAALASACSSTPEATSEFLGEVVPGRFRTFAWLDELPAEEPARALSREVRAEVSRGLEGLGLRLSLLKDADVLVGESTVIETERRQSDPYVTGHIAEIHEYGTLSVELLDVRTGEPCWRGTSRERLRRSALVYGGASSERTAPQDAPREWRLEERVRALLAPLAGRL